MCPVCLSLLRTWRVRLDRPCLPRLFAGSGPGLPPLPPERPRCHSCLRLARAAAGHRAPEGAHGLEDALEGAPYPGCKEWAAELVTMKPTGQSLIID
jgi:hypothetical protein